MRSLILLPLVAAALWGCAHSAADNPPVCDGRHLRPANPYGSVLAPEKAATPVPGNPAAPAADKTKGSASKPGAPRGGCGR